MSETETTWLGNLLAEISSTDLTKRLLCNSKISSKDTVVGDLSEYLQRFWRVRENYREKVQDIQGRLDDLAVIHEHDHEKNRCTETSCKEYWRKVTDLVDLYRMHLEPFLLVEGLFQRELDHVFPHANVQGEICGIRDGKVFVTCEDNSREDEPLFKHRYETYQTILAEIKATISEE